VEAALADARAINPTIEVIKMSAWKGEGLQAWFDWLLARIAAIRAPNGLTAPIRSPLPAKRGEG
jgi:hypothetical protein